jgi:hypothetical protein
VDHDTTCGFARHDGLLKAARRDASISELFAQDAFVETMAGIEQHLDRD